MIDEMAMLTAYGDRGDVREALRLLAEILTQGRACLVSVIGLRAGAHPRTSSTSGSCSPPASAWASPLPRHVDMVLGRRRPGTGSAGRRDPRRRGARGDRVRHRPGLSAAGAVPGRPTWPMRRSTSSSPAAHLGPTRRRDRPRAATRRATTTRRRGRRRRAPRHPDGGAVVMRTLDPSRTPEYRAAMTVIVGACTLAALGSVIPAVEYAANVGMAGLVGLAVLVGRRCGCWPGSCANASRTPPTPEPPPPGRPPTSSIARNVSGMPAGVS